MSRLSEFALRVESDSNMQPDVTTVESDSTLPVGLNPRQRSFVVEYLKDKNATQAYMRAYGVSHESADRAGPRLLGHVGVRTEIERLERAALQKVQQATGITLERTLAFVPAA